MVPRASFSSCGTCSGASVSSATSPGVLASGIIAKRNRLITVAMMQRSETYRILDSRKTVLQCSLALVLVILVAGEAISLAQQQADFTLARGRVGTLTIGMTAEEVIGVFGKPRVKRVDLQREGMSTPALEI